MKLEPTPLAVCPLVYAWPPGIQEEFARGRKMRGPTWDPVRARGPGGLRASVASYNPRDRAAYWGTPAGVFPGRVDAAACGGTGPVYYAVPRGMVSHGARVQARVPEVVRILKGPLCVDHSYFFPPPSSCRD